MKNHGVWLIYTVAVASCVSLAFYIDTTNPQMYRVQREDFFTSNAGGFMSESDQDKGISVTEETCRSDLNQTHLCLIIPDISLTDNQIPIKHFGLTVTGNSTHSQLTVCSPSGLHPCDENSTLNQRTDYCEHRLTVQGCTKRRVDLVFLFDGSGSMTEDEFHKNKEFIVDIMESLKNSSIKFAAVQFSTNYRKVFNFTEYEAGTAHDKLMREPHMKDLTNTHKALKYVLEEIFDSPDAGASPDATKVLVLITDGDPSDRDRDNIIKRYNEKNIIRFVIAVKGVNLKRFETIASKPENAFKIENYDGLTGVLENVQKKIFQIEESSGFSAVFYKVCGSSVLRECNENFNLNTVCHKITNAKQISSVTPALPEYTKRTVDLVFLFDGSGSMTEEEFHKNKEFIQSLMESLKEKSIKFAAVQFSKNYRKVFNFTEYEAGTAHDKLMTEPHMKDLTNTHKALKYVLEEIFDSPDAGASPDATKVLVLITDGDPSDRDRDNIIKRYNEKNIIRFVIAVKNVNLKRFETIASKPENAFKIENYDGLTGVLEHVQKKIFQIEEESSGFSAVFYKNTLTLGPLGSNSWRRFLQECPQTQMDNPETKMASYQGNSVSIGQRKSVPLYFTSAPMFGHTGQVALFTHNYNNWTFSQRITGEQSGSYFGAELCLLDVNSDSDTDFLLVGAPLFQLPSEREGQIYVYTLTDEIQLESVLNVAAPSTGRFGTSISSLKDLNGDGLRDVAVGAPFEDDNRGVVYIYLGDRHRGIRSTFSQRIMGQQVKRPSRFFGLAIDWDHGRDGLVIGSQDMTVIFRCARSE
ncbi:integrin alpha-L-like isoform X2 [Parambassis ranga]|uniref:Integrin alpha-L-like isoform X2 n=1 Tax=Parambassis ranga TaxID=210632 RepID=A0A6P7HYM2_9TELE|nr:integrin alpha-L-like isoform X2 [Parambassis ranga]